MDNKYEESDAEYTVQQFVTKVNAEDMADMDVLIGSRADGTLEELREGTLAESDLDELKVKFSNLKLLAARSAGASKVVGLDNGSKKIQFQLAKQGGKWVITEMNIR
jgi:carbamoylphosphate synthase large subunit